MNMCVIIMLDLFIVKHMYRLCKFMFKVVCVLALFITHSQPEAYMVLVRNGGGSGRQLSQYQNSAYIVNKEGLFQILFAMNKFEFSSVV